MTRYIELDALIAGLKKRISDYWNDSENTMGIYPYVLEEVIKYINTFEVKEVDLEKVIEEYFKGWTDDYDNGGAACHYQYVQVQDCKAIAKHFFELGLRAQKGE